jgi:hypothetical protein
MTMTDLRHLTEAHRLAARAEALADARLNWIEPTAQTLFRAIVGRSWTEYGNSALAELHLIYVHTRQEAGRK